MSDVILPEKGQKYGFTNDKFLGYLYADGDTVWVTAVISIQPNSGNFARLLKSIESDNKLVKVPTPFSAMNKILSDRGYKMVKEQTEFGEITVMLKDFRKHE